MCFYLFTVPKKEIAFKNAAWLRYKMRQNINEQNAKIYQLNPYTDVDVLVKKLFGITTNYIWTGLNETVETSDFTVNVEKSEVLFEIYFNNREKQSLIINPTNYRNYFQFFKENEIQTDFGLQNTVIIEPNTTQSVVLTPEELGKILIVKIGQDEILVELS